MQTQMPEAKSSNCLMQAHNLSNRDEKPLSFSVRMPSTNLAYPVEQVLMIALSRAQMGQHCVDINRLQMQLELPRPTAARFMGRTITPALGSPKSLPEVKISTPNHRGNEAFCRVSIQSRSHFAVTKSAADGLLHSDIA
jgi:hypothetical protein